MSRKRRQKQHRSRSLTQSGARGHVAPIGEGLGAVLPVLIIALAVLWDWALRLSWEGWNGNEDISIFIYLGQRLSEGVLHWTQEFDENKPLVYQFLFYIPALLGNWFNPYKVWHLMSMGACLIGAWCVYLILRDVFSAARGFGPKVGHYAGLYGSVFTLYLLSTTVFVPHHVNALAVSMALAAVVLTKHCLNLIFESSRKPFSKAVLFLLACFCASIAVGVRTYLIIFLALIPAWLTISAQLDKPGSKLDYRAAAIIFLSWNACVALMTLGINVLPYILAGEWSSFTAGLEILTQQYAPYGLQWVQGLLSGIYNAMGPLSTALLYAWAAFLLLFALLFFSKTGLAGGRSGKSLTFDLLMLTAVTPCVILVMILPRNFWPHYLQFLMPFVSIAAASLFVLLHSRLKLALPHWQKALAVVLAAVCVSPTVTELQTRPVQNDATMAPAVQNLSALLDEHGLEANDFLAPYNQYVHVRLNQYRHGFPSVSVSVDATLKGWLQEMNIPGKYNIPKNSEEYCQMLDEQGSGLIVFFAHTTFWGTEVPPNHLANCSLSQYDFHNLSSEVRQPSDIAFYFLRKYPQQ